MALRVAAQPKLRAGSAPAARSRNVAVASASSRAPVAVSLLSAAALLLAGAPNAARAADLALGEQVFNGNCAACHMGGRNSVIPDRTLDKAALEAYLEGGFSVEAITYQVENGKGAMPAWADRLSEEEIASVAEYVYKQASTAAWKY
ncbi:hypothetical protein HYH03_002258 [Edaphochlamys debaryana]|uniref:Cytochrome c-553 n=1 Tax=Edaphochlamys debaryana TaxID=47281 RepID=A0A835YEY0_9CHLO|nr:hypothetical protein HYH03_002258 [Edaphochlamys debaryana]|eukprot:KAG2499973.1 hypothetical protein HYH03_002258 [Edaphochlamys debaryana]